MKKTDLLLKTMRTLTLSMKRFSLLGIFFACLANGHAQLLIGWNANSNGGGFGASPWAPVTLNSGINMVTGLSRGANLSQSGTPAGSCWGAGGTGWGITDAGSVFFEFSPQPGSQVSLSSITACLRRSNTGPVNCNVEFSINGGAYTQVGSWSTNVTSGTVGQANSSTLGSYAALQNIQGGTVVRFRFIYPGASAGNWYVTNGTNCLCINGTIASFSGTVTPTASITCNGLTNGALSTSVTGSTPPYTYSWMPSGGTASVATGLGAGTYTCRVVSSTNDTTYATYNLTQPIPIAINIATLTNVTCFGGNNGSASLTISGGTPAYTYSWAPASATSAVAGSLTAGVYTVTVTDSKTCTATRTINITQAAPTLSASASSSAVCNGATVTLSGAGATTYSWTNGVVNGQPFTPTASAVYSVTGTNTLTGCVGTLTLSLNVRPNPTITVVPSNTNLAICDGGTITLSGAGASTYTWTGGVLNGAAFSPTSASTYTVYGKDTNNCVSSATIALTVGNNPTVSISSSRNQICKFESATLTAAGASSYSWTNNGSTSAVTIVSPTITTTYTVTGTTSSGCVAKGTFVQFVAACLGIENIDATEMAHLSVFPNPNNGEFTISAEADLDLVVINELGQQMRSIQLNTTNQRQLQIRDLQNGIYFITGANAGTVTRLKVVVAK